MNPRYTNANSCLRLEFIFIMFFNLLSNGHFINLLLLSNDCNDIFELHSPLVHQIYVDRITPDFAYPLIFDNHFELVKHGKE